MSGVTTIFSRLRRHQALYAPDDGGDGRNLELAGLGLIRIERHLDVELFFDCEDTLHQPKRIDPDILKALR